MKDGILTIGEGAFIWCKNLQSVNLPDSITHMGSMAFRATAIQKVTIPPQITQVEGYLFEECHSLQQATLLEGIKRIGVRAFFDCPALHEISIPDSVEEICEDALGMIDFSTYDCIVWAPMKDFVIFSNNPVASQYALENGLMLYPPIRVDPEMVLSAGDVTGDASVDALDALYVLRYAVGIYTFHQNQITAGDMNQDENIDATDALLIKKRAVGK